MAKGLKEFRWFVISCIDADSLGSADVLVRRLGRPAQGIHKIAITHTNANLCRCQSAGRRLEATGTVALPITNGAEKISVSIPWRQD